MSLKTWKEEFYPIPSLKCSKEDAARHSLRKWRGLRPEALQRHECWINAHKDVEGGPLGYVLCVDADSCALCQTSGRCCEGCPLLDVLGEPCDGALQSPYQQWRTKQDPEPMIQALEQAVERLEREA